MEVSRPRGDVRSPPRADRSLRILRPFLFRVQPPPPPRSSVTRTDDPAHSPPPDRPPSWMQPTPPRRTGRSSPNEDDDVELAPSSLPVDEPQSPSPSSFSPRSSSPHASTSSPTKTKPPEQSLYSPRTDLEAHSLLLVLSVLGCLIRLGLNALFAYPGQEVFALVWAQGVGCLVMGVCVARKEEIERWVGKGWYAGLGTGELSLTVEL